MKYFFNKSLFISTNFEHLMLKFKKILLQINEKLFALISLLNLL